MTSRSPAAAAAEAMRRRSMLREVDGRTVTVSLGAPPGVSTLTLNGASGSSLPLSSTGEEAAADSSSAAAPLVVVVVVVVAAPSPSPAAAAGAELLLLLLMATVGAPASHSRSKLLSEWLGMRPVP